MHGRTESGNLPGVVGLPLLLIGSREEQVPSGVQSIDLELKVVQTISRRVEENFKVVVAEDDGIVLGKSGRRCAALRVRRPRRNSRCPRASSLACEISGAVWPSPRCPRSQRSRTLCSTRRRRGGRRSAAVKAPSGRCTAAASASARGSRQGTTEWLGEGNALCLP